MGGRNSSQVRVWALVVIKIFGLYVRAILVMIIVVAQLHELIADFMI